MDDFIESDTEKVFAVIGAIIGGAIALLASCLQPIEGVPGYQLITQEDFSIVFGFALAAIVGGLIGIFPGVLMGRWIEDTIAEKKQSKRPTIREQAFAEFQDLFLETLYQKSEERISSGQVVSDEEISHETINQVVPIIAQKYGLSRDEMDEIALRYVRIISEG